jgi:SLOG cluster2
MMEENMTSNLSNDTGKNEFIVPAKADVLSRKCLLKNKTIGISISESDDLQELGYGVVHLKDAMIEVARYILALGGKVAYGGDMRQGGFTELIFDLLASYKADKSLAPHERFYSYLAFPLSLNLTPEKEAELRLNVSFKKIKPPDDLIIANKKEFLNPDSTENLYVWSRCLTEMREKMEPECDARIFIGGRTKGFKGKCPGILEELLIALKYKHPVYLVGAFGGITKDAISALSDIQANSFTDNYYFDSKEYKNLFALYNSRQSNNLIDYKQYFTTLKNLNFKGLSGLNGLTETENKRLAVTPHISEIVYLILKGLTNRFTS